jgi:thiosulfate dehydrogenase [quinone] large subunit
VSYHSHPYYTGSDIVFFFAWMPLVIAGAGGVLSADAVLAHRVRRGIGAEPQAVTPVDFAVVRRVCGQFEDGRCLARDGEPCAPGPCPFLAQAPPRARRIDQTELDRRTVLARGGAAAALSAVVLVGGGLAAGLGRLFGSSVGGSPAPVLGSGASPTTSGSSASSSTTSSPAGSPSTTAPSVPPGTKVGPAKDVPVGGAASFQDPSSGDPALVVQPVAGTFLAFDAVCPHAGCTVGYSDTAHLFVCPCHGSEFNGHTGAVEVGPAQSGLMRLTIAEGPDGQLYVS